MANSQDHPPRSTRVAVGPACDPIRVLVIDVASLSAAVVEILVHLTGTTCDWEANPDALGVFVVVYDAIIVVVEQ